MENGLQGRPTTVCAYVDPNVRRLVDAINTSGLRCETFASCSGHRHKPSTPYVAFRSRGWRFVRFLLSAMRGLNAATRCENPLRLREVRDGEMAGSIRLGIYPWLLPGIDLTPLLTEQVTPPRRLVWLWWRELDELAAMIEGRRTWPSRQFVTLSDGRR